LKSLPAADLDEIFSNARPHLETLRGAHVLVTGATGFFGTWLVAALLRANDALDLRLRVTALAREASTLLDRIARPREPLALELVSADVRTWEPVRPSFTHVIHAATSASARLNESDPRTMFEVVVGGTRRILDVARAAGASRVLFTSSGAVYGRQDPSLAHVDESCACAPDPLDVRSAYAESKRAAELLCAIDARSGLEVAVARAFAFVGPRLPLDAHFAIGNFLGDALAGRTIVVAGDGTPRRSYLYASDLVAWLLAILVRGGSARAYNVGAERDLSIRDLATTIAARFGVGVEVRGVPREGVPAERYVPSTRRARTELGVRETVTLEDAIERTARWHGWPGRGGAHA
jgi:dTDP-glucose 4,6-dehydratase